MKNISQSSLDISLSVVIVGKRDHRDDMSGYVQLAANPNLTAFLFRSEKQRLCFRLWENILRGQMGGHVIGPMGRASLSGAVDLQTHQHLDWK